MIRGGSRLPESGEICTMQACDINMMRRMWVSVPEMHKTAYHGHERNIYMGRERSPSSSRFSTRTCKPFRAA